MVLIPERAHRTRLGLRVLFLGVAFALLAPVGLFLLPLAALLLTGPVRRGSAMVLASFAIAIALWWLWGRGDPSDQLVRAAGIMTAIVYVGLTRLTRWTHLHRALTAIAAAGMAMITATALVRLPWRTIRWWVESNMGFMAQLMVTQWWSTTPPGTPGSARETTVAHQMEDFANWLVPLVADLFPAIVALQALAGLALAAAVYYAIGGTGGRPVGRFVELRFSEHLGWLLVAALAVLLLGGTGGLRQWSLNVCVVLTALYAARGVAVAGFTIGQRGGPNLIGTVVIVLLLVFLLPVVLTGTIVLGAMDGRVDLRKRWATPQ